MIAATTTATSSILRILLISMLSASHVSDAFSFIPLSSSTTRNALTQIQLHQQLHQQQQQQQQPFMKRSCGGVTCTSSSSTSTSLYAEGGEEGKENDTEVTDTEAKGESDGDESSGASANDILNSPAFLKRKLEVLESDIAKIDEKISNANKVYEENKAEWGPQLDDLRKEVSHYNDDILYTRYCGKKAKKPVYYDHYDCSIILFSEGPGGILFSTEEHEACSFFPRVYCNSMSHFRSKYCIQIYLCIFIPF